MTEKQVSYKEAEQIIKKDSLNLYYISNDKSKQPPKASIYFQTKTDMKLNNDIQYVLKDVGAYLYLHSLITSHDKLLDFISDRAKTESSKANENIVTLPKPFRLRSGIVIPTGTKLGFSTEGYAFYKGHKFHRNQLKHLSANEAYSVNDFASISSFLTEFTKADKSLANIGYLSFNTSEYPVNLVAKTLSDIQVLGNVKFDIKEFNVERDEMINNWLSEFSVLTVSLKSNVFDFLKADGLGVATKLAGSKLTKVLLQNTTETLELTFDKAVNIDIVKTELQSIFNFITDVKLFNKNTIILTFKLF